MGYRLDEFLMFFSIYSILGWIVNMSMYCLIEKRVDRRSICKGPYSPAFGFGAVALIFCNIATPKYLSAVFGVGVLIGLIVQGIAAASIRILSGKWLIVHKWYLIPLFGIANVLMVYRIQPLVSAMLMIIPPLIKMLILLAFWMSFVPDFIEGIAKMIKYKRVNKVLIG